MSSASGGLSDYASKSQQASMAESYRMGSGRSPQSMSSDASGWVGWILFAAVIMVLVGAFHVIQGLVALFKDDYYAVAQSGLVLNVSYTAWGWLHIVGGVIVVAAGIALFSGRMWARVLGTAMACVSAVVNVGFLSAYPIWSTMMIALDVAIIMALTVHGSDMADLVDN
jgi:hypothetical protein